MTPGHNRLAMIGMHLLENPPAPVVPSFPQLSEPEREVYYQTLRSAAQASSKPKPQRLPQRVGVQPRQPYVTPPGSAPFPKRLASGTKAALGPLVTPVVMPGTETTAWETLSATFLTDPSRVLCLGGTETTDMLNHATPETLVHTLPHTVPPSELILALRQQTYTVVVITHVDCLTGLRADVASLCRAIRELAPEALLVLDASWSFGIEPIALAEWELDVVFAATHKALGLPSGAIIWGLSSTACGFLTPSNTLPSRLDLCARLGQWSRLVQEEVVEWKQPQSTVGLLLEVVEGMERVGDVSLSERCGLFDKTITQLRESLVELGFGGLEGEARFASSYTLPNETDPQAFADALSTVGTPSTAVCGETLIVSHLWEEMKREDNVEGVVAALSAALESLSQT